MGDTCRKYEILDVGLKSNSAGPAIKTQRDLLAARINQIPNLL